MGRVEKVGVLLIHGIGDQRPHEHLDNVARNFIEISCRRYGAERVSVTAHPGFHSNAPLSLHIAVDSGGEPGIQLDFHEVWWRDLGDEKTFGRIARFWLWALSISGTHGQFSDPTEDFDLPMNKSSLQKRVGFSNRLKLFFTTTFFFVMLLPIWLLTNFARIIPGLPRIHLFDAAFSYMSSVKLYQDFGDKLAGTLEDFDQPRRFSIQRKVHQGMVKMARLDYDRWYLAGHSLGSVIGFKALFSGDHGFARLLSRNVWEYDIPDGMKYKSRPPLAYPDEPKCPNWLTPEDGVRTEALLEKCLGFISWGSPLETFAHTWPATIPITRKFAPPENFEWINLYDAADVVASPLSSFDQLQTVAGEVISPVNISTRSHSFIGYSHIHYLKIDNTKDTTRRVGFALLEWLIGPERKFVNCAKKVELKETVLTEELWKKVGIAIQCFIALFMGLLLWPKAAAFFVNALRKIPEVFLGLFNQGWADAYNVKTSSWQQEFNDPRLTLDFLLDLKIIGCTAAVLFAFAVLHYLLIRPKGPKKHKHHEWTSEPYDLEERGAR